MDAIGALSRLGSGEFLADLYEALIQVSEEVAQTGNPGAVNITLKVTKAKGMDPTIVVEETIARKPPTVDAKGAVFFALNGELHREDPRQVRMEFRAIDPTTGETRMVADVPAAVRSGE